MFRFYRSKEASVWDLTLPAGPSRLESSPPAAPAGCMFQNLISRRFRIPLRRGRLFNQRDNAGSPSVVIVNEAFAKKYWPKADPVGQRIIIGKGMGPDFAEGPRDASVW